MHNDPLNFLLENLLHGSTLDWGHKPRLGAFLLVPLVQDEASAKAIAGLVPFGVVIQPLPFSSFAVCSSLCLVLLHFVRLPRLDSCPGQLIKVFTSVTFLKIPFQPAYFDVL